MQASGQLSPIQCIIHDVINKGKASEPIAVIVSPTTTCQELIDRIKTQFVSVDIYVYCHVTGADNVFMNEMPDKSLNEVLPPQKRNVYDMFVTAMNQPDFNDSNFSFLDTQSEETLRTKPYHKCFPASFAVNSSQNVQSESHEACASVANGINDNGDNTMSFAQYTDSSILSTNNGESSTTTKTFAAGQEFQGERKVLSIEWLVPTCNISCPDYVGLVNQAMTCYLNSLLQTLYMTPEFRNAVYRWQFAGTEEDGVSSIPYQLQRLFLQLQTSKQKSVETVHITRSFGWDSGEAWEQHDIQELCREMFDALEKTWQNTTQENLIKELYEGQMEDCIKCLKCGFESSRTVTYMDIQLPLKSFEEKPRVYGSVEEALMAYCAPEVLSGNNQYHCDHCKQLCDVEKKLKFLTFPYLLTVQLMRFAFDYNTMRRIKLNHRVEFRGTIALDNFISCSSQVSTSNISSRTSESVIIDEDVHTVADESKKSNDYELFSVLVHSGSAVGGHYYAYIKSFDEKCWYSFNDTSVHKISWSDVCSTFGTDSPGSSSSYSQANAYMLMYRQVDKEKNARAMRVDDFSNHLQEELSKLKQVEVEEIEIREKERNYISLRFFYVDPTVPTGKPKENVMRLEKTNTLEEATLIAWQILELEKKNVAVDCVRLVRYDSLHDVILDSLDGKQNLPMTTVFGYLPKSYGNELMLEQKQPQQRFLVYKEKVGDPVSHFRT